MKDKEITNEELSQLADLLERAITSDNPSVKKAIQNLVIVASLDGDSSEKSGPISQRIHDLEKTCRLIENKVHDMFWIVDDLRRQINANNCSIENRTSFLNQSSFRWKGTL